ncbi:hypothetical protein M9H77_22088 [Catharanthus roseus]|uniref:Uncharacterized protein n=1 Tax=Catharanthus roseus TaxID=4058 RepID=A0ACC0AR79_CATRO|nr:hypothetical protein M9H77_22088 [Catharanthus roseus]
MPRRSIWKGSFVDAFLLRMKKKRDLLLNRKIWSCRSSISLEFVDCFVLIYNGKTSVRCKITEGKVGHKFREFASTRKRRPSRTNIGQGRKRGPITAQHHPSFLTLQRRRSSQTSKRVQCILLQYETARGDRGEHKVKGIFLFFRR